MADVRPFRFPTACTGQPGGSENATGSPQVVRLESRGHVSQFGSLRRRISAISRPPSNASSSSFSRTFFGRVAQSRFLRGASGSRGHGYRGRDLTCRDREISSSPSLPEAPIGPRRFLDACSRVAGRYRRLSSRMRAGPCPRTVREPLRTAISRCVSTG